jgi:hypothetical protein
MDDEKRLTNEEREALRVAQNLADQAVLRGALKRVDREKGEPWTPPADPNDAIAAIREFKKPSLDDIVTILAVGSLLPPDSLSEADLVARRIQASRAIFGAAKSGKPEFLGRKDVGDDSQAIPPNYFNLPRILGSEPNSIAVDFDRLNESQFDDYAKWDDETGFKFRIDWYDVCVDSASLIDWLISLVDPESSADLGVQPATSHESTREGCELPMASPPSSEQGLSPTNWKAVSADFDLMPQQSASVAEFERTSNTSEAVSPGPEQRSERFPPKPEPIDSNIVDAALVESTLGGDGKSDALKQALNKTFPTGRPKGRTHKEMQSEANVTCAPTTFKRAIKELGWIKNTRKT